MKECWIDFCKEADIDQQTGCTDPKVLGLWFAYVVKNYHEPLPEPSPWEN